MNDEQDSHLLCRLLSKLSPDIFFHPLWIYFIEAERPYSAELIQRLLQAANQLQIDGDLSGACQVLLICAVLQDRLGDYAAALNSLEQVWTLAECPGLSDVRHWAAWGTSAVYTHQGRYQQADESLKQLQDILNQDDEWVLADIIWLLRRALLSHAQANVSGRAEASPVLASDTRLGLVFDWLLQWDEVSFLAKTPGSGAVSPETTGDYTSPDTSFSQRLRTFWQVAKGVARGELRLTWVRQDDYPYLAHQPNGEPSPPPTSIHPGDEDLLLPSISSIPYQIDKEPSLAIYCLGPFRAHQNGQLIENWSSRKAQAVFKYLVVHHQAPVAKDILMDTFWPDADPEAARRNLHQAIYTLRQTLKMRNLDFQHIHFEDDCYRLNPALNIWLDCEEFEQHVQSGRQLEQYHALAQAMAEYGIAEGLYQGDFMGEDLYEEWPQAHRQYLWQTYLTIVYRLADYYLTQGEYTPTIALSQRVLTLDNCQEEAHQNLMKCYLAQGQRHLALHQYQLCLQVLKKELDLPPSTETQMLYTQIVRS